MHHTSALEEIARDRPHSLGPAGFIRVFAGKFWGEALIITVAVLLWVPRLSGPIDLRWDASVYYLLGTSLTNGHGYRIESEPGAPAALQYPPLLPAIIGLHQRVLGTSDPTVVGPWLRITYAFLFVVFAVAVLRLARRYLGGATATVATLLCLLNPFTIFLSDLLFAEVPFALVSVMFALVAGVLTVPWKWSRELVSFVLAACGFLLRSVGIVLLAAWMLDALLRRRWQLFFARTILTFVPVLAWQAYVFHVRSSAEYSQAAYEYQRAPYQYYNVSYLDNMQLIDPFKPELGRLDTSAFVSRLATNLATVPGAMGQIISAKEKDWRGTALWLQGLVSNHRLFPVSIVRVPIYALAVLVLVGLFIFIRRGDWIMTFIIAGSFGLMCLTPWPTQFTRYLEPLAPFLTIAAVLCIVEATGTLAGRGAVTTAWVIRSAAVLLFGLAIIVELHTAAWLFSARARQPVVFLGSKAQGTPRWFLYDQSWQDWQEAIDWIDKNAAPGAIIATSSPHFYYLQTGRLAVLPPMAIDPGEERRLLASVPVSYAIVDELEFLDTTRRYVEPALKSDSSWHLVHSVRATSVYERKP